MSGQEEHDIFAGVRDGWRKWPKTERIKGFGVKIWGRYIPPQAIPVWATLCALGSMACLFYILDRWPAWEEPAGVLILIILLASGLHTKYLEWLYCPFIGVPVKILITPETIGIGGLFGYKKYKFDLVREITMTLHEKAEMEADDIASGKKKTRVYLKTVQVIMMYGEKPVVIASIFNNPEKAHSLHNRLITIMTVYHTLRETPG